jgi:hypothetical protein
MGNPQTEPDRRQVMKTCIHCGAENGDSVKFCEHCEKPMEIAIAAFYCPNCKREIAEPMKFCPYCGTKLENVVPAELRGTWLRRGVDSGQAFDTTVIFTVDHVQLIYSNGRVWIGVVKSISAAENPSALKTGEYPSGWTCSYSVTAAGDDTGMEVGKIYYFDYYLNAAKNALTQHNDDPKDIWIKQEER